MPFSALVDSTWLAGELRKLAADKHLAGRKTELEGLADCLSAGTDLDVWAEIDLVGSFARADSLTPQAGTAPPAAAHRARGWSWTALWARFRRIRDEPLEAALGVMVFIPLLVTWAGLRLASGAYGRLAKSDPQEASRPFLQLWQSGFDGQLSSYERFDSVALTAVGLIGLLLLVAVWHAWVRTRADRQDAADEADRAALLARLTSVLTRTQLALVAHRHGSPQRFAAELTRAAGQLRSLTGQAVKSHDKLVLAAEASDRAASGLTAAAERLSTEVPLLGAAADRIETAVRTGTDVLRDAQTMAVDAARSAQESTRMTGQDNVTAVREVGDRVVQAGTLVDAALQKLTTVQGELGRLAGEAVQASDRASQSMVRSADLTGDAVDGMRRATELWDAAAAHWQDAAARLDAGIRQLSGGATGPVTTGVGTGTGNGTGSGVGTSS